MNDKATAPRLIDANALLEEVKALNKKNPDFAGAPWNTIDDAIFLINSAPTVETTDDVLERLPDYSAVEKYPNGEYCGHRFENPGKQFAQTPLEAVKKLEASLNQK